MIERMEEVARQLEQMIKSTEKFSIKFCESEDRKLAIVNAQLKRNKEIIDELRGMK